MYCPQCGGANEDTAGFCKSCGLDLGEYRQQWQTSGSQASEQIGPEAQGTPPYGQQSEPQYRTPPYESTQYRQTTFRSMPRIPSYLGWAIAVLILCFWPTGIAAVVYASQVDNRMVMGDVAGARESSRKAKMWCWISFGIGVGFWLIGILIAVLFAAVWEGTRVYTF